MAGSEAAGRSADEWSQRLREKAARLEARAERIEQGARGERRTAGVLNPRSGDGWYVLHDLAVPDSRANIDHVVVAPGGVFVVDSKDWSGRISAGKDTLWVYRYPKTRELETLLWETSVVAAALRAARPRHTIPVRGVISLTNAAPPRPVLTARGVTAVAVADLVQHLGSVPPILNPAQVESVAGALDGGLRSRSGAASSIVRPDPLPPVRPTRAPVPERPQPQRPAVPLPPVTPRRPASERRPASRTPYPAARPTWPSRPRRARPTANSKTLGQLAAVVGIMFAALVALGMVGSALKHLIPTSPAITAPAVSGSTPATVAGNTGATAPTTAPTTAPATTPRTASPAGLQTSWTCPAPGRGWTATLAWPPGESPYTFTLSEIAPSASGPWTLANSSRGPAPIQVTGIAAGTTEWVRAGVLTTLQVSGKPITQGQITAPAGC